MSAAPTLKWKRTWWFVPSEGKFIWGAYYTEGAGFAQISMKSGAFDTPPNGGWWFKLIRQHGPNPGGRLTIYKSDNGFPVYYDMAQKELFIYNKDAKKVTKFNGAPRVRKLFAAASNTNKFLTLPTSPAKAPSPPKPAPKAPSPPKPAPNSNNGYTKTNFLTMYGNPIYLKNSKAYHKFDGNWHQLAPNAKFSHKNNTTFKGKVANVKTFAKTAFKSGNGQNVDKFKNDYYIVKDGKFTKKFKGKAALPALGAKSAPVPKKNTPAPPPGPIIVPVPVQVPVVKPDTSHLVAPKNAKIAKLGLLLKAVLARKKKLAKTTKTNHYANYCKNFNMGLGYIHRTNAIKFFFQEPIGFTDGTSEWKNSLDAVKWKTVTRSFNISYSDYLYAQQLVLRYHPPMKNFKNFNISNIIDMTWFQKQNKWLKTLTPREVFLMYGFSHNGDIWAHSYLDGKFSMQMFTNKVKALKPSEYFALFFQARDFYNMATGDATKDYTKVLTRVRAETNPDYIKSIIQMFIDELNTLCAKAPVTTKPFVVWRGVKDDTYIAGIKDKQYTLNRFASTSVDGEVAYRFGTATGQPQSHVVQRILVMPGSKCLLMFGTTKYNTEFEILMPRGSTYIIRKTEKDVEPLAQSSWLCTGPKYPPMYNSARHVKNLTDIILLGQSKRFIKPKTTTVTVPVAVPAAALTNVQKIQKILNTQGLKEYKVLNKLGQGGFGAVFRAANSVWKENVAVKLQKSNKNFISELNALHGLKMTGVAPVMEESAVVPWSQNAANLIPKGLKSGNTAGIIVMSLVKGRPLRNFMTGPPINKALKNKITNAVGKVSSRGYLHGDLHRNNIIINNKGNPVLIDFGKSIKGPFKSVVSANTWLKGLGHGHVEKYGKKFYYSNAAKTRSHYSNKNFLNKIQ